MRQQPAFAGQATGIAREAAVRADDAVAGHDHAHRVGADRKADGAHGGWPSQLSRQVAVADRASRRNAAQRLPHGPLEVRALRSSGQLVQRGGCTREIPLDSLANRRWRASGSQ